MIVHPSSADLLVDAWQQDRRAGARSDEHRLHAAALPRRRPPSLGRHLHRLFSARRPGG